MADMSLIKSQELSWEKGITPEFLLKCMDDLKDQLKGFVMAKIWHQNPQKRLWINRHYGSPNGFYREALQILTLRLLERVHMIPENLTYKWIWWNLRIVLRFNLYRAYKEVSDSDIVNPEVDEERSFIENYPADTIDLIARQEEELRLQNFKLSVEKVPLSKIEKKMIKYRYFDELDYDQICKKLGIGYAAAYNGHNNALKKIRTHFVMNQVSYAS